LCSQQRKKNRKKVSIVVVIMIKIKSQKKPFGLNNTITFQWTKHQHVTSVWATAATLLNSQLFKVLDIICKTLKD